MIKKRKLLHNLLCSYINCLAASPDLIFSLYTQVIKRSSSLRHLTLDRPRPPSDRRPSSRGHSPTHSSRDTQVSRIGAITTIQSEPAEPEPFTYDVANRLIASSRPIRGGEVSKQRMCMIDVSVSLCVCVRVCECDVVPIQLSVLETAYFLTASYFTPLLRCTFASATIERGGSHGDSLHLSHLDTASRCFGQQTTQRTVGEQLYHFS